MRHRKLQELIGALADGELRAADRPRVEKHLKKCPECRRDLEFIRKVGTFAESSPPGPQDPDYWDSFPGRIRAAIAREQAGAPASRAAEVKMFQDSFYRPERRAKQRAILFPLSVAAHVAVIVLLIVLPLLRTGNLPTVEVYSAFLAPPPPPPPPRRRRPSGRPRRRPPGSSASRPRPRSKRAGSSPPSRSPRRSPRKRSLTSASRAASRAASKAASWAASWAALSAASWAASSGGRSAGEGHRRRQAAQASP